jgi:hypothetical protein
MLTCGLFRSNFCFAISSCSFYGPMDVPFDVESPGRLVAGAGIEPATQRL